MILVVEYFGVFHTEHQLLGTRLKADQFRVKYSWLNLKNTSNLGILETKIYKSSKIGFGLHLPYFHDTKTSCILSAKI